MVPLRPLRGIIPPIPTPTDTDGRFAEAALRRSVAAWDRAGLDGYLLFRSNGEGCLFDLDEQLQVLETMRDAMSPDRLLLVGVNVQSARQALRALAAFASFRPNAALVLPPYYYKTLMTPAAVEQYYTEIAELSPIPIMIYNMPAYTGLDIPVDTIARLSTHPNIVGMKESAPNIVKIADTLRCADSRFALFAGSASYLMAAAVLGARGGIAAVASVAPRECKELFELASSGQLARARELQLRLIELNQAVTVRYGIAGLKYAMALRGLPCGEPRKPLLPLGEEDRQRIARIVEQARLTPLADETVPQLEA